LSAKHYHRISVIATAICPSSGANRPIRVQFLRIIEAIGEFLSIE